VRALQGIRAVLLDMDGTLVDSEHLTREVVEAFAQEHGAAESGIPDERLHGVTWHAIAADLEGRLGLPCSGDDLHRRCHARWLASPPPPVPGVTRALRAARAAGLSLVLATSSHREAAETLLARPDFAGLFDASVTADDIQRSKPDPQIFLLAAERVGVPPAACLVFEDSLAGLRAAAAAGMASVAVLLRSSAPAQAREMAAVSIVDFGDLEPGFFERIRA
jgi:HAD superfamily hydrolase (TIGR01509 family)